MGTSGPVNVAEVIKMAEDLDRLAVSEPEPEPAKAKRGGGRKRQPVNGGAIEPEVMPPPPPDPEFIAMCNWGVGAGVDACKARLDWTEPGIHWRIKVAECFARIIDRLRPMQPGPLTDLFTAGGYVGLWVISNVSAQRAAKDTDTLRDDGKREDVQDAGISPS